MFIPFFIIFILLFIVLIVLKVVSSSTWRDAYAKVKDNPEWSEKLLNFKNSMRGVNIKTASLKEDQIVSMPMEIQADIRKKKKIDQIYGILFVLAALSFLMLFIIK